MTQDECKTAAVEMFEWLVSKTDGPQDAAEVLLYVHILVWRNQDDRRASTGYMLDTYKTAFLEMMGEGPTLQ